MTTGWMMVLMAGLAGLAGSDDSAVRQAVLTAIPGSEQMQIRPSPLAGLVEVAVGARIFYVSGDGQFLLGGPLYDLAQGRNLTDDSLAIARQQLLAQSTRPSRIIYPAAESRHTVTVVTNVDCPYCRQLHEQRADYLAQGITLEYVMTPFGGPGSESYQRTAAALCAADPAAAITRAMAGEAPAAASDCAPLLDQHMALARDLGAATTPNLILPDGRLIAGYQTPQQLITLLRSPLP